MRGHEPIIAMRVIERLAPVEIIVTDLPDKPGATGPIANHVYIEEGDLIETLDLRFLAGTFCHVSVKDNSRGQRIAHACAEYAARTIASFYEGGPFAKRITDTQEQRSWIF